MVWIWREASESGHQNSERHASIRAPEFSASRRRIAEEQSDTKNPEEGTTDNSKVCTTGGISDLWPPFVPANDSRLPKEGLQQGAGGWEKKNFRSPVDDESTNGAEPMMECIR